MPRQRNTGPKPQPRALRAIAGDKRGTTRAERRRGKPNDHPTPPVKAPDKPGRLSDLAAEAWDQIVPRLEAMRVLSPVDEHALELLCETWAQWKRNADVLIDQGDTYETVTEQGHPMVRKHPAATIVESAYRRCVSMLVEFGMTSSSRARLSVPEGPPRDPLQEFLDDA